MARPTHVGKSEGSEPAKVQREPDDITDDSDFEEKEEEIMTCSNKETRVEGTFKVYYENKGFGFVTLDEGGDDVFVHVKDNPVLPDAQEGETVTFN